MWGGAAQPVEFGYDAVGQRTTMTTWRDPATNGDFTSGIWPADPGPGATTTWVYQNAPGLMWYKVGADSMTTVYNYDELGRTNYRSWVRRRTGPGAPPYPDPESAVITRWVFSPVTGQLTNADGHVTDFEADVFAREWTMAMAK